MSFREIRNFAEILKILGYHRMISLESFREPNFYLVTNILVWLVKRFDADYNISNDCSTAELRVLLIRSVTEFMLFKIGLKLNMKKLYQADGHAVKEMLKIVSLLHEAIKINQTTDEGFYSVSDDDLSIKIQELKLTRELTQQITQKGSSLFEILKKEPTLRESRLTQAKNYVDINEVELLIKNSTKETNKNIAKVKEQIENIAVIENNLDVKINKKENDLERVSKRLETLKCVRPAILEEYERYEEQLNQIYENYVIKFRCHTYLQQQLNLLHSMNQAASINVENDEGDNLDKMPSLVDDGSLSSLSPSHGPVRTANSLEISTAVKKPVISRIRTAIESHIPKGESLMYGNARNESIDFDNEYHNEDEDDDDDVDDDDDGDTEHEFLDDTSFMNNNSNDSTSQLSDTSNFKINEDKSDDTF